MIDYGPFWDILRKSDETWYTLAKTHHIPHSTLHRLRNNKAVSTKTLDRLCEILDCDIGDIVTRHPAPPSADCPPGL